MQPPSHIECAPAEGEDRRLAQLAHAAQGGAAGPFRDLVGRLSRPLLATAYRYVRDWETARDLTQETWLRAHAALASYDARRSFRAWLFTIHRNGCLSHLRRAQVRREVTVAEPGRLAVDAIAGEEDGEQRLARRAFHELLMQVVAHLPARQREVFLRVAVEQRDRKTVADELGIAASTLRVTLLAARRRVAMALRKAEVLP